MSRITTVFTALIVAFALPVPSLAVTRQSDAQVRQRIIAESIDDYPGTCPCPDSVARNGSRCGGRSAYSRPGGYAPKCYPQDVSAADIRDYRRSH